MEENNLSQDLANLGMESFTVTEMAVIAAIKQGRKTLADIEEETTIKTGIVKSVLEDLQNRNIITQVPGDPDEYIIRVNPEHKQKKYKFKGSLLLPVSSFHDEQGQRWVTRGKWYKIDEDTDILNDIEWEEDMSSDVEMKSIMKQISDSKKKATTRVNNINLGTAPAEIQELIGKWTPMGEDYKVSVINAGETESIVTVSPRIINEAGLEFPWGTQIACRMSNDAILKGTKEGSYTPAFKISEFITIAKKICAFKSAPTGDTIEFADIFPKAGKPTKIQTKSYAFSTGACQNIGKLELSDDQQLINFLRAEYGWFLNVMNITE